MFFFVHPSCSLFLLLNSIPNPSLFRPQVSQGYRREISKTVPPRIRALISDCWAQDPRARPTAQQALEHLTSPETLEEIELWSRVPGGIAGQGGCACSIM